MVGIKSIFFDLFGVLIGIDQSATIHHISKKVNLPYLETKDIVMGEIFMRLERGEIQFKQYFQDLQYALPNSDKLNYDEFKTMWTTNKIDEAAKSSKPSLEIFNYALNKTGATTESSVFIDDLASNVSIAKTIGFTTHHYQNYEEFDTFMSSF